MPESFTQYFGKRGLKTWHRLEKCGRVDIAYVQMARKRWSDRKDVHRGFVRVQTDCACSRLYCSVCDPISYITYPTDALFRRSWR